MTPHASSLKGWSNLNLLGVVLASIALATNLLNR
jgi:hypothetical protein